MRHRDSAFASVPETVASVSLFSTSVWATMEAVGNIGNTSVVRVLIVDDDPSTVAFMHLAFESAGDVVDTASSVEEAMRQATDHPPDVVLSDLTFKRSGQRDEDEVSDGFLLLKKLRSNADTAHVGVLAVSGADFPEVLRATEDQGFDGFVAKPVDVASLILMVHRLGEEVAERAGGAPKANDI